MESQSALMHIRGLAAIILILAGISWTPSVAAAPRGTLTIAQGIDADTHDPQVTSSPAVWSITLNIYDTLITRDRDGKLQPGLAVSWRSLNGQKSTSIRSSRNRSRRQQTASIGGSGGTATGPST